MRTCDGNPTMLHDIRTTLAARLSCAIALPLVALPVQEAADEIAQTAGAYFALADWNGDGSIVFKEAAGAMSIDREAFRTWDGDRDGRIQQAEFVARYRAIVERGGAVARPVGKPDAAAPAVQRAPDELLSLYDDNRDRGLDLAELARLVTDSKNRDLEAEQLLGSLDKDASLRIEGAELQQLAARLAGGAFAAEPAAKKTLAQLFETPQTREAKVAAAREPARIAGPASDFRRLDHDGDGGITVEDLVELQRPLALPIRPQALVSALDKDGDGRIGPDEFAASMR